jgi:MFS family permease
MTIARLMLGQVCVHSSLTGMRMACPLWILNQGYGTATVGGIVALFALVQIFLLLPVGRYADRHGLQRPMRWCVGTASLGIGLAAMWPMLPTIAIAAMLCGAGTGAANLVLQRHVGRVSTSPQELRRAFSWLSIAPAAANFVGPLMAGLVIDLAGYRSAFAALAALPVVGWLLLRRAQEAPVVPAGPAGDQGSTWDLLRNSAIRRLLLMNWFMTVSWDLHALMVPVLAHERNIPASVTGTILGAFALGTTAVRLGMPLIASRVQEWKLIAGANAVAGVLLLLYPFTTSAPTMALCSAALGAAMGSMQPMVNSMLHQVTPHNRHGEAIALRLIMINLSMFAMPLLLGLTGGVIGTSAVFWSLGLVVGGSSGLGVRLRQVDAPH